MSRHVHFKKNLNIVLMALLLLGFGGTDLPASAVEKPNFLLISIDTLRADHLGCYGYERNTSPFIDSLAADGIVFKKAHCPIPATDPSHASLFTGLHPLQHGMLINRINFPDNLESIAEVFQQNGYVTMGAVAVRHLGSEFNFNQGFDAYSDQWDITKYENSLHRRVAPDVNADVLDMLQKYRSKQAEKPFFLFIHYFDVHTPYLQRDGYRLSEPIHPRHLKYGIETYIDQYDSEIVYVDQHIKQLFQKLDELGLAENLITCVTADHGEQLGEHGLAKRHADLYRENMLVPFIIHGKNIARDAVETNESTMSIPVTLLGIANLGFSNKVAGRNLLQQQPGGLFQYAPRKEEQPILVVGHQFSTVSLAVIEKQHWFIENFDYLYKDLYLEPIEQPVRSGASETGTISKPFASSDNETIYLFEMESSETLDPFYLSLDIQLKPEAPKATATILLEPKMMYCRDLALPGSCRISYPVSRRDITSLTITPGNCIQQVRYRFTQYETFLKAISRRDVPHRQHRISLYKQFVSVRKHAAGDELYNLATDPDMVDNMLAISVFNMPLGELFRRAMHMPRNAYDAYRLQKKGEARFLHYTATRRAGQAVGAQYTSDDIEALKALGYLQ